MPSCTRATSSTPTAGPPPRTGSAGSSGSCCPATGWRRTGPSRRASPAPRTPGTSRPSAWCAYGGPTRSCAYGCAVCSCSTRRCRRSVRTAGTARSSRCAPRTERPTSPSTRRSPARSLCSGRWRICCGASAPRGPGRPRARRPSSCPRGQGGWCGGARRSGRVRRSWPNRSPRTCTGCACAPRTPRSPRTSGPPVAMRCGPRCSRRTRSSAARAWSSSR